MYNLRERKGNVPPGVKFEDLPDDAKCPVSGAGRHLLKGLA